MDTAQWPQGMEEIIVPNTCSSSVAAANINNKNKKSPSSCVERKVRPEKEQAFKCPRCNSSNTKFCYYNNYSLTQPRFFCKTCRRYWTEGGSLRNIPVGGASRKNKRSSSSNSTSCSSSSSSSKKLALVVHDHHHHHHNLFASPQSQNPKIHLHQGQDLNLGFPPTTHTHQEFRSLSEFIQLPTIELEANNPKTQIPNSSSSAATTTTNRHHLSASLELLNGLTSSRSGLTPFMPMSLPDPNALHVYSSSPSSSGFPSLQDFKPTLNFSLDGLGKGFGSLQQEEAQGTNNNNHGRLLFPFQDLKQVSSNNTSGDHHENNSATTGTNHQQTRQQQGDSTGYWSGMSDMGGSW